MASTPLLRPIFRSHLETLRTRRLPRASRIQRRFESSSPQKPPPPPPLSSSSSPRNTAPKPEADPFIPTPSTVPPLPFWQRLGPVTHVAQAYARAQRSRPWLTQTLTTLFIYLCADISAQRMSRKPAQAGEEPARHDLARTSRSLVVGGLAAVPGYTWFLYLARNFNFARSRALSILVKVVINQLAFTPVFNTYFFGMHALLSGYAPRDAWDHIRRTVPTSFVNSWKIWPAVTAFNFAFVPLEYRSIFAGCVAVGWQTYLSFLNRQAEIAQEAEGLKKGPHVMEPVVVDAGAQKGRAAA
ncbi:hypothetical protein F4778DRAFT_343140 [Xylariomycetidae sp. FL2044]|nr:hypothetical protein F4778DRAFT_343140 [Xylariomycetidae sp. FL2044]